MPPQARSKRPVSVRFIAGGQGEWSVATRSMVPSRRPCHRGFAVGLAADGRSALEQRGAVGDVFRGEVQVVRAGLDGDGQAFGARGCSSAERARWRDARCAGGSGIGGRAGASGGWLRARLRRGARRDRWRSCASRHRASRAMAASMGPASSAWTSSGRPDSAMAGRARSSCSRSIMVKPSQPG